MTTSPSPRATLTSPDGIVFRDLNGNGVLDPYENPTLPTSERVEDLLSQLSIEEKVGLMFQTVATPTDGSNPEHVRARTSEDRLNDLVDTKLLNHFNVTTLPAPAEMARWNNHVQALAEQTPHGIPVTLATDPRHGFMENVGASFSAGYLSAWPEPIGLAAIGDVDTVREFADIARQEYLAVGIRASLHPSIDLTTEPRWARQYGTFGQSAELSAKLVGGYLEGFQGERIGANSVACMTKHFPGGGPQRDGEDPHFPYGREQVYPGDNFEYHLEPFRAAIAAGTSAIMPYYGMPIGLTRNGEPIEEVGFGFNRQIITGLLREELGYDGVVCTDWGLVTDSENNGATLPARAWGMEQATAIERVLKVIDAGCDQFGGEECVELLLELVATNAVSTERIDESVRRLLTVKFELGLFDDPYVDEAAASAIVGSAEFVARGLDAQSRSMVPLEGSEELPLTADTKVFVENLDRSLASEYFTVVDTTDEADVAIVRTSAPWDPRGTYMLEPMFHAGSLEFGAAFVDHLADLARVTRVVCVVTLDRPALVAPLRECVSVLLGDFGSSDRAALDVLAGRVIATGRLPFDIPASVESIRAARSDVPGDSADAPYRAGYPDSTRPTPDPLPRDEKAESVPS